jgi:8-oxo-dGTP pyrophosphatase MutT (NUDIX family)
LNELEAWLTAALAQPLPGLDAQLRMAPRPRVGWDPSRVPEGLRDGAALVLIYPMALSEGSEDRGRGAEAPHILLTVRGSGLRKHTGQVSFPGGAVDPNESFETAALREASEEVGVIPASVRVLGRLTPLHIPVSGYLLHPIVGIVDQRPAFRPAEWEVHRILEVPLAHFTNPANVKRQTQTRNLGEQMLEVEVPYFDVDGEVVWGATAMAIAEFLAVISGIRRQASGPKDQASGRADR